jgi:hypothetical protein
MAKAKCKHQYKRETGKRKSLGPQYGEAIMGKFCDLKEFKPVINPESGICAFQDKERGCPEYEEG